MPVRPPPDLARMRLLTDLPNESLWRGDIIRLVHNYDLGPGSEPVDLMIYDPRDETTGLGLMVVSGYKAGLTLSIFPIESCKVGQRSLETAWLIENWNQWFCYTYHTGAAGMLLPVPIAGTLVLDWTEREIIISNADSRPA